MDLVSSCSASMHLSEVGSDLACSHMEQHVPQHFQNIVHRIVSIIGGALGEKRTSR